MQPNSSEGVMSRRILAIWILVLLSGCSTMKYVEPTNGERAEVRFATNSRHISILRVYEESECRGQEAEWMRLLSGFTISGKKKSLGMPLNTYPQNAYKEVYVSSSGELHGMFSCWGGDVPTPCAVPFSFHFENGRRYEVFFDYQSWKYCSVQVSEIVGAEDSGYELYPLILFPKILFNGFTRVVCVQRLNKWRLY
jgi:hypothetical protein